MSKILAEKLVAALITVGFVATLTWQKVVLLYIVLGQGHFLIAYLYQYKAGKMTKPYLAVAVTSLVAVTGLYLSFPNYRVLVAVTTVYFLVHMLLDELYLLRLPMELHRSPMHLGRLLEMTPILLLYSTRVIDSLFSRFSRGPHTLEEVSLTLSWCSLGALVLLGILGRYRPDWRSLYFLGWSAFLFWAVYTGWFHRVPTGKLTGFIIIYHYLAWYFHYFLQLKAGPKRVTYLRRVVVLNAVVLGIFALWGQQGVGRFLFQNDYFYIWTLLHLITSTRLGDIKRLFTISPPSG